MLADHGLIEERRQLLDDDLALITEAHHLLYGDDVPYGEGQVILQFEPEKSARRDEQLQDIWAQSIEIGERIEALSAVIFNQRMGWAL